MEVTGIQLREAIKRWALRRDTSNTHFSESLFQFESEAEEIGNPNDLMASLEKAELAIATLQVAQTNYNLQTGVTVRGDSLSLCDAVKRIGGAGRMEKMWRSAATNKGRDKYSYRESTRDKDKEYMKRTVSVQDCMKRATEAGKYAGSLRDAIAVGNTGKLEIEGLDPALFE